MYRHTGLTRAHKVKSYTVVHHTHACTMRRLTVYTHTERYIYVCVPRDGAMGRDGTGRTDGRDERTMFSSFVFCCIPRVFSFSSVSLFPSLFIHTYTCNFSSTLISLAYILILCVFSFRIAPSSVKSHEIRSSVDKHPGTSIAGGMHLLAADRRSRDVEI